MKERLEFDTAYKVLKDTGYSEVDITDKNLNEYVYSGIFHGFNVTNAPDENYVEIIVIRHNETWVIQECKNYIGEVLLRTFKSGVWTQWDKLDKTNSSCEGNHDVIIVERPHTHRLASENEAGFMSPEDKRKLNALTESESNGGGIPEADLSKILQTIDNLQRTKSDINHNHDNRYLTIISSQEPTRENYIGKIWIQI